MIEIETLSNASATLYILGISITAMPNQHLKMTKPPCCVWHHMQDLTKIQSGELYPENVCYICLATYDTNVNGITDHPVRLGCNLILGSEVCICLL